MVSISFMCVRTPKYVLRISHGGASTTSVISPPPPPEGRRYIRVLGCDLYRCQESWLSRFQMDMLPAQTSGLDVETWYSTTRTGRSAFIIITGIIIIVIARGDVYVIKKKKKFKKKRVIKSKNKINF